VIVLSRIPLKEHALWIVDENVEVLDAAFALGENFVTKSGPEYRREIPSSSFLEFAPHDRFMRNHEHGFSPCALTDGRFERIFGRRQIGSIVDLPRLDIGFAAARSEVKSHRYGEKFRVRPHRPITMTGTRLGAN
jgi:hypothetical protein